jgi:hypothetical protein
MASLLNLNQRRILKEINMNHFLNWPHNWFGFWRPIDGSKPERPLMSDFVDSNWDIREKEAVLAYLDRTEVIIVAGVPSVKCRLCGEDIGNPSAYKSDGVWLWPNRLTHGIRRHGIRVPDRMVVHMRRNGFKPPDNIKVDVPNLPWPP